MIELSGSWEPPTCRCGQLSRRRTIFPAASAPSPAAATEASNRLPGEPVRRSMLMLLHSICSCCCGSLVCSRVTEGTSTSLRCVAGELVIVLVLLLLGIGRSWYAVVTSAITVVGMLLLSVGLLSI